MPKPVRWTAPTMFEHLPTLPSTARARRVVAESEVGNHSVRCDRCPRVTSADMLLDVRALGLEHRAELGLTSEGFVCDACRELIIHLSQTQRAVLYQRLGAPPEIVAELHEFSLRKGDDPRGPNPTV